MYQRSIGDDLLLGLPHYLVLNIRCWFELVFCSKGCGLHDPIRLYQATETCFPMFFPPKNVDPFPDPFPDLGFPLGELGENLKTIEPLGEFFWATLAGSDDCITLQARSGDLVEAPLGSTGNLKLLLCSCWTICPTNHVPILYLCFKLAVYCACEVSLAVSPHFFQVLFQHLQPQFSKSKAKLVGLFCGFKYFGWTFPHATARCLCRREFRNLDGGLCPVFGTLKSRNHQWFLKCRARWLVSISGLPNRIG